MPNARKTDPQTSHAAAASVGNLTATKLAILDILTRPMPDEDLIDRYYVRVEVGLAPKASPSGIRSRRKELFDADLVESAGFDKTASGRSTVVWRVTLEGRSALMNARVEAAV